MTSCFHNRLRVLARELSGQRVEVTHALHRHQERFVSGEPSVDQARYLLAQMVFQLGDIDGVNRLSAPQIAAPLAYLLLQRCRFTLSRHR